VKEIPDVPEVAFATTKVCAGGLVPPIVKAKLSGPAGVTVTLPPVPLAATTMLTLTVCTADAVVKLIVPPQVAPPPIPLWFTETEKFE
jgi:hypothetical protein